MHEVALMGDILSIIDKDIRKRGFKYVKEISLIVGEHSTAMPDALEMAFFMHRAQGVSFLNEKSQLFITIEESKAHCGVCDQLYKPDQRLSLCPNCGLPTGRLIQGETLNISSYEGE